MAFSGIGHLTNTGSNATCHVFSEKRAEAFTVTPKAIFRDIVLLTQLILNNLDKDLVRITFQFIFPFDAVILYINITHRYNVPGNQAKSPKKPFYKSEQSAKN